MVTISNIVKKIIESRPMLSEAIANDIVNFANLAEQLKPEIEAELGKEVNESAIVMALRRHAERISQKEEAKIPFKFNSDIIMKTGLSDIALVKSQSLLKKLKDIYDLVDYGKGDTLNIIHGNYEVTIVINEKYIKKLIDMIKGEKTLNIERDLVSLTIIFSKDFFYTPGILSKIIRILAWENVNIIENISTMTELIFIVSKKDAIKAYNALQSLIEEK